MGNTRFMDDNKTILPAHVKDQSPRCAILSCADSRVIPEYIFHASIGELFVVRVAGNITSDPTVRASLDYAVDHLKVPLLIILAHTGCGAVKVAEQSDDVSNPLINEIRSSFEMDPTDHVRANLLYQLKHLPKRSDIITAALKRNQLHLLGAIYHLEDGRVEFL
jgi:carbonic anhydrase